MNQSPQLSREGTASFQHDERVDFHQASDHLEAYDGQLHEARDRAIAAYAQQGIDSFEILLGKRNDEAQQRHERSVAYVSGVSKNLTAIRQYEQDVRWDLETESPILKKLGLLAQKTASWLTGSEMNSSLLKMSKRSLSGITERELLQKESAVGRQLFGAIPDGITREFFNLDATTWIWHEGSEAATVTTRYEAQNTGILKAQDGAQYSYLEGKELADFVQATKLYYERVLPTVYNRNATTGNKLPS